MIAEAKQREILREAVPLVTMMLVRHMDSKLPQTDFADRRRMAIAVLSHVLAAMLAQETPESQEEFAHMIGGLIRANG